jgi:endonuclease/exonuclease/phosphatase family metal-dependent hydrolase
MNRYYSQITMMVFLHIAFLCALPHPLNAEEPLVPPKTEGTYRVATFNTAFSRDEAGALLKELHSESLQARRIAGIIRTVQPDIVLLNEFDYAADQASIRLFLSKYLEAPDGIGPSIRYPHYYAAPVNTGEPSGLDLDQNGSTNDPNDAFGFGRYPGHYGMVLLSKDPIDTDAIRTFQKFLWHTLPNSVNPVNPTHKQAFYSDEVWRKLRLSSKSHWDVPIRTPLGTLHLLCSHPTPPAFDGPEDRNGKRNHDEIRLWKEYIENPTATFLVDDQGQQGGLSSEKSFIIAGDLNADPLDGDDEGQAIRQLLQSKRVNASQTPAALGGKETALIQANKNTSHRGNPEEDTSDFNDRNPGNLRVDYVLPSSNLQIVQAGVFWPNSKRIQKIDPKWLEASDHRLVWIDVKLGKSR